VFENRTFVLTKICTYFKCLSSLHLLLSPSQSYGKFYEDGKHTSDLCKNNEKGIEENIEFYEEQGIASCHL
jgi:hypothetical protein